MSDSPNKQSSRWIYSVTMKITRNIPGTTLTIIILTIAAQISLLAASFLPLKAIILIGSPSIPSYFPMFLKSFERDEIFIGLCLAAVVFYGLYMGSESLTKNLTLRGSEKLVKSTSKLIIFDGQDDVARRAYSRLTRSLSTIVFLTLTTAALGLIYLELMLAVLCFWACMGMLVKAKKLISKDNLPLTGEQAVERLGSLGSVGFLAAFSYLAFDLLSDTPPSLLPAIVGVLLTRQIMQRATQLIQDILLLKDQRFQISALFFNEHKLIGNQKIKTTKFLSLFDPKELKEWLPPMLDKLAGVQCVNHEFKWHQSGVHDVFCIEALTTFPSGKTSYYLVKIFNSNRSTLAINEATLLSEPNIHRLPSMKLLEATLFNGYHCHIFQSAHLTKIPAIQTGIYQARAIQILMSCPPPRKLVDRYSRSRPFLWDRLSDSSLRLLGDALVLTDDLSTYKTFFRELDTIRHRLRSLPLYICNSNLGVDQLFISDSHTLTISYWGNWSIEPLGAGLSLINIEQTLPSLFTKLSVQRTDTKSICVDDLHLSALCFQLDQLMVRQNFLNAVVLLQKISEILARGNCQMESPVCSA